MRRTGWGDRRGALCTRFTLLIYIEWCSISHSFIAKLAKSSFVWSPLWLHHKIDLSKQHSFGCAFPPCRAANQCWAVLWIFNKLLLIPIFLRIENQRTFSSSFFEIFQSQRTLIFLNFGPPWFLTGSISWPKIRLLYTMILSSPKNLTTWQILNRFFDGYEQVLWITNLQVLVVGVHNSLDPSCHWFYWVMWFTSSSSMSKWQPNIFCIWFTLIALSPFQL
jgi:hypothetical protein